MRQSRKKMIDVTCRQGVRKRVDSFLLAEYQSWREKKEPRRNSQGIFTCGSQTNNNLILEYIRQIYHDYNIADPLLGSDNPELITSPSGQIVKQACKTEGNQLIEQGEQLQVDSPRDKVSDQMPISNKVQAISKTIEKKPLYQSGLQMTHYRDTSMTISKGQSGYIKTSINQMQTINQINSKQAHNNGFFTPKNDKKYFEFSNKVHSFSVKRQLPIKQVYRYCLACEQAVLEANIQCHEGQCEALKKLWELDIDGILQHLTHKINNIRAQMKQTALALSDNDASSFKSITQILEAESQQICNSGKMTETYSQSHNKCMQISSRWCRASEEVSKLRWFVRVREEIIKHFGL